MSKRKAKQSWWDWYWEGLDDDQRSTYWTNMFPDQEDVLSDIKKALQQVRKDNNGRT